MTVRQADPYGKGSYCIVVALHDTDSVEAETLRAFRDRYVYSIPGGRTAMNVYYRVSPGAVRALAHCPRLRNLVSTGIAGVARAVSALPGV